MSIQKITARQILDSRGLPTVEVDVITQKGLFRASVPSGTFISAHEAVELRDQMADMYLGQSVLKAVSNVNKIIAPALMRKNYCVTEQHAIDEFMVKELDATNNKSYLGANAILAVSLAILKAGAAESNVPVYRWVANLAGNKSVVLPVPSFSVISGGRQSSCNNLAFQTFQIMPTGARSLTEAVRIGSETYHRLQMIIEKRFGAAAARNVAPDGSFAPDISTPQEALDLINEAIRVSGYMGKIVVAIDCSANTLIDKMGRYSLTSKSGDHQLMTADKLVDMYLSLASKYPIKSLEDPFGSEDWDHWAKLCGASKIQVVGDQLLCTNTSRIEQAIKLGSCNAVILKVSQIGSFTEALEACNLAKRNNWNVIVSHRLGETEDTIIADLSVGLNCGQIKTGAPCRSERLAKYNQLLRIEEELGCYSLYAGDVFQAKRTCQ